MCKSELLRIVRDQITPAVFALGCLALCWAAANLWMRAAPKAGIVGRGQAELLLSPSWVLVCGLHSVSRAKPT